MNADNFENNRMVLLALLLASCATTRAAHVPVARYHGYRVHIEMVLV